MIALTTLVVCVAATALAVTQAPRYEATSKVLISRTNLGNVLSGTPDPASQEFDFNRIVQTQADLARVPRVADRTLKRSLAGDRTPEQFLAQSQVTTDPNTDILTLTVRDADRTMATRLARNYAREFVDYRQAATIGRLQRLKGDLEGELATLSPSSALAAQNRAQLRRVRNLISLGDSSISVVHTARIAEQVQPRPLRSAILGLLLGLALGIGLAFLVDLLDTRLRRSEEIDEQLGMPLLARLPAPPRALRKADRVATFAQPDGPDADAFRALRTNLAFADLEGRARSILISSAVQSEGKSTTAVNLAVTLARAGRRVILVDLDLRRPYLDRFLAIPIAPGATNVVLGEVPLDIALKKIDLTTEPVTPDRRDRQPPRLELTGNAGTLRVLAAGALPPNVGEFVTSAALRELLEALRSRCDVLLVDTPPLLQSGDAMALTAHVDALVLIARLGVVRRPMIDEVKRLLATSPVSVLGVVVTDAALDDPGMGYGYGYGYGKSYDHSSTNGRSPLRPRSHA